MAGGNWNIETVLDEEHFEVENIVHTSSPSILGKLHS